jgi:hypothetical protein
MSRYMKLRQLNLYRVTYTVWEFDPSLSGSHYKATKILYLPGFSTRHTKDLAVQEYKGSSKPTNVRSKLVSSLGYVIT